MKNESHKRRRKRARESSLIIFALISIAASTVAIAQVRNPELIVQIGHKHTPGSAVFNESGTLLATYESGEKISLWEVESGRELRSFKPDSMLFLFEFAAAGNLLITGESEKICLWDLKTGSVIDEYKGQNFTNLLISPDKRSLAGTDESGDEIWLWRTDSLRNPSRIEKTKSEGAIVFSPDGKIILSEEAGGNVKLWDIASKQEIREFKNDFGRIAKAVFSPNGKILATTTGEGKIQIFDVETREKIKSLTNYQSRVELEFSRDEKHLYVYGFGFANIVDLTNWKVKTLANIEGQASYDPLFIETENRKFILLDSSADGKAVMRDIESGAEKSFLKVQRPFVLSPDRKKIILGEHSGKGVALFDIETGKKLVRYNGILSAANSVTISRDGKKIAIGSLDHLFDEDIAASVSIIDVTNNLSSTLIDKKGSYIWSVAFNSDATRLAAVDLDGSVNLWNMTTGKLQEQYNQEAFGGASVLFTGKAQKTFPVSAKVIDMAEIPNGQEFRLFDYHDIYAYAKSPDGKKIAIANVADFNDYVSIGGDFLQAEFGAEEKCSSIDIQDVATEKRTCLKGDLEEAISLAFSPDGNRLASGHRDNIVRLWNVRTGRQIRTFEGHQDRVNQVVFSPTGKILISAGEDGTIKFWSIETGKLLATFIVIERNEWLIFTSEGFFDGTPNALKKLDWRFDNDTFNYAPVEAFFKEFYYPGLLQEIIQNKPPKPPEKDLSQVDIRQPKVKITGIDDWQADVQTDISSDKPVIKVKIEITDNASKGGKNTFPASSGAKDLRLFRNGSLVRLWEEDVFQLTEKDGCRQISATKETPRKAVCETDVQIISGRNEFAAYAFNHENVKSNDAAAEIKGADSLRRRGKVKVLTVGIDKYANKNHDLYFAVADAVDFGRELRRQQVNLKRFDAPEIVRLTDAEATKQNILYALERFARGDKARKPDNLSPEIEKKLSVIEKTQPEDIFIVFFSGHGTAAKDRFYLIPQDGFPLTAKDEQTRISLLQSQSISDLELENVVRDLDAGQLMMIVDACNSGQALEAEEKRRGPMNSKGLAQLAFEKGMYILTAAQSFEAALEVSRTADGSKIEHGLLTFSLLQGLTTPNADTDANKEVIEREWFNFAVENVPRLQLEEMRMRSAKAKKSGKTKSRKKTDIVFVEGDDKNLPPAKRALQTPRVFYRREMTANPFTVAGLR